MSKIDEKKEYIGILKTYLGVLVAFILATGTGVSKIYLHGDIGILFWLGIAFVLLSSILFFLIAKKAHKEIRLLRDIRD